MRSKPIYLDYNATTPISPEVAEEMWGFVREHFGNPSSSHWFGQKPKQAVELARSRVAALLCCDPSEIILMSGGTEAINWSHKGTAWARRRAGFGNHIITTEVEHVAVLNCLKWLAGEGFEITIVPVDEFGMVSVTAIEKAVREDTILVSVMLAQNEVGTIMPVEEITRVVKCKNKRTLVHVDCSQALGKIDVDISSLCVDFATVAGHKLYAPKGVGALYLRKGVEIDVYMHGGGQEKGLRGGTENVILYAGLGKACELLKHKLKAGSERQLASKRDELEQLIVSQLRNAGYEKSVRRNGHPTKCLPNTLSLSFRGVKAKELLSEVTEVVAASAGAACHTHDVKLSHVLSAMKVSKDWGMGTVRLSIGEPTTNNEIREAAAAIGEAAIKLLRKVDEDNLIQHRNCRL